jgi:hypothetical protein
METQTGKEPKTAEQLPGELDISKTQLTAWLKRTTEEGKKSTASRSGTWRSS